MADYVEDEDENSSEKIDNTVSEPLENQHKITDNECADNIEELTSFTEESVEKEEEFCEEKLNISQDDEVSLKLHDDVKIAELETSTTNDNDHVTTATKGQEPEAQITGTKNVLVVEKDLEATSKVEDVSDIFSDTAKLVNDIPLESSEFRHRHLREKVENTEDSSSSHSTVRFEPVFQENSEDDNVSQKLKEDVARVQSLTETRKVDDTTSKSKKLSLFKYFMAEISHGYVLELDEDKYADKRRKVHTFMKIPREVEKLMIFGFMLCLDCFLFMFTFLPVRVLVALWKLISGIFCCKKTRILEPAQICDLLKASIILVCCCLLEYVDFSVMYHTVRGQSVIKLYVIYNMLEVADRLFSSLGQDILDSLFWTATEPRDRKRQHFGTLPHFALGVGYVFLHAVLVLFQATCLNVAVNSHNKALLVILVSNQFVELKGNVFKRFERNNLFQVACSDIRERFHYLILVSIVCLRNLTEFNWNLEHLYVISPYLLATVSSEYFVDWVKHAFITKFNDIQPEVYTEYRSRLAKDATSSRQKNAHADHFDIVSRRMGFIPLPLGSLVIRVIRHSVHIYGVGAVALAVTTYLFLTSVKILNSIIFLGKASQYAQEYPSAETTPMPAHATKTAKRTVTTQQQTRQPSNAENTPPEQDKKPEKKPTKSLAEIDRYTLCSKEIVVF